MAKFTVQVQIRHLKHNPMVITEEYDDWNRADTAYELYNKLGQVKGSSVDWAELVEHRHTKVHKTSRTSNVTRILEAKANAVNS
jgi:hypothetical protein